MKALTTILAVVLSLALLAACGSGDYKLKVAWEDETESSSDSGSSNTDSGDGETENGSSKDGEATTAEDGDDTEGGIEYLEQDNSNKGKRHFMGTYQFQENIYYNGSYNAECEYGFPLVVRAYSHDNVIDFENASGKLVWIADLYEDETFDFEVGFLNKFGNPSIELICTCFIDEAYWDYYNDEIQCGCEPSNDDGICAVFYEKMEN